MGRIEMFEQFQQFMEEYVDHFDRMLEEERGKLDALLSYDLHAIEQAVSTQQASAMKLQNMEKQREQLQQQAGFGEMTFREITSGTEQGKALEPLFERLAESIEQIRLFSRESMEFVKMNLTFIGGAAVQGGSPEGYNAAGIQQKKWGGASTFQTKI